MEARKREAALKSELAEVRFTAGLADQRSEELSSYIRRNNLRIYGITEGDSSWSRSGEEIEETPEKCEKKILSIIRDRLRVDVMRGDIEAVHRLGRKQQKNTPRGIIVRFVSRRVRGSVIGARKNWVKSGIVIVEDLT